MRRSDDEAIQDIFFWLAVVLAATLLLAGAVALGACSATDQSVRISTPSFDAQRAALTRLEPSVVELFTQDGMAGTAFAIGRFKASGIERTLFVTAAHVFGGRVPTAEIQQADVVDIVVFGEDTSLEHHPGLLLYSDPKVDLAVVGAIDELRRPAVTIAAREPERYEQLVTLTNPSRALGSGGPAILSARHRMDDNYLLTGPCWHGSSGGVVANLRGEVVGVVVGMEGGKTKGQTIELHNYCYAVGLTRLRIFLSQVL